MKRNKKFAVWVAQLFVLFVIISPASAKDIELQVAEAPANNLSLTISAIQSARKYLLVNTYEFTSFEIATALLQKIEEGVNVVILQEGQVVGGISDDAKAIEKRLLSAMESSAAKDHYYIMSAPKKADRRFYLDHAKYMVIDGDALLVGSENYAPTGNPAPKHKGNRGWEVFVHDATLARQYEDMFAKDADTSFGDVEDQLSKNTQGGGFFELSAFKPSPFDPEPLTTLTATSVDGITSPDTSLEGLLAFINGAKTSLDIEQMTFASTWKKKGEDPKQSPLLAAVIKAARRGVAVRVLLNDEKAFSGGSTDDPAGQSLSIASKPKNPETVDTLNQLAADEGLNIKAAIADLGAMGVKIIHNKGAVADGDRTLVSSINWNENAVDNNREAAVLVTSPDVYEHYENLFEIDWKASEER